MTIKHEVGGVLKKANAKDSEPQHLGKEANIVRRDISQMNNSFNDTFEPECQKHGVPAFLKTLIGMIMKGLNTKMDPADSQAIIEQ